VTAESALVVPVPEAEPVVQHLRTRYDPAAAAGVPAHITVLYPFIPPDTQKNSDLRELESIFLGVPPFAFKLARVARFPDVVYLTPEPADGFSRLTAAIATLWPDRPPYGGRYAQIIPHLTVAHTSIESEVEEISAHVEPALPLPCLARHVWLMSSGSGVWSVERSFPFAGARVT
jgi:2'-5' RNA ligase